MNIGAEREVLKIIKTYFPKGSYKKIIELKNSSDFLPMARHLVVISLEKERANLQKKIVSMEKEGKDVFFAKNKFFLVHGKIANLKANFCLNEFIKVFSLIKDVEKEIKNV